MPPRGVKTGSKRGRQYEHIKESGQRGGMSNERAEEMAARTVNTERSEAGEKSRGGGRSRKSSGGSRKSSSGGGARKSSGSRKSSSRGGSQKGSRKTSARAGSRKSSGGRKTTARGGSRAAGSRKVTARRKTTSRSAPGGSARSPRGGPATATNEDLTMGGAGEREPGGTMEDMGDEEL